MALELYTDRKINASYQEASGVRLGSHVHVNKAIGFLFFLFFFNGPKLSLPHGYSHRSDLCGQTFNKRISLRLPLRGREFNYYAENFSKDSDLKETSRFRNAAIPREGVRMSMFDRGSGDLQGLGPPHL